MSLEHIPVLRQEVRDLLSWSAPISSFLDATVGGGGHLYDLLSTQPAVEKVFALDRDSYAIERAKVKLAEFSQVEFYQGSFADLLESFEESFDRVLIDLGVSSFQLDEGERGFSFQKEGPLDMRMNREEGEPAWQRLQSVSEKDLADIFFHFGEEPRARPLARKWVRVRKEKRVETTQDFVAAFGHRLDSKDPRGRHPLTRVFQAIRIWVNDEFGQIDRALAALPERLSPDGRVAIITFHSLEDRRVKLGLRGKLKAVNKKVLQASDEEIAENSRARSAKLRVYEKETS